nr:MAG TPA: hypothetical protein [Caudoviricetes sp.]
MGGNEKRISSRTPFPLGWKLPKNLMSYCSSANITIK